MSTTRRWTFGVAALTAAAAAAALALGHVGLAPADAGPMTAAADQLRRDLQGRVQAQLEALTDVGRRAAEQPRLHAALAAKVDAATLVDLFATENWWRPVRERFPVSRLITAAGTATHGSLDISGEERRLIQTARRQGQGAAVVAIPSRPQARPYLIVAVRVGPAYGDDAPVVVLARPVDANWLSEIAAETQSAAMLTDSQAALLVAGVPTLQTVLPPLAAPATATAVALDPEGRWSAVRLDLGAGLQLWGARAMIGPPLARAGIPPGLWWLTAGLLAAAGLTLLVRGKSSPAAAPVFSRTTGVGAVLPSYTGPGMPTGEAPAVPSTFVDTPGGTGTALAVATAPLPGAQNLEGRSYGRYRLLKKIADGGQSEIYRAVAHGPQGFSRAFIVKRLKPELARSPEQVAQFIDEARVQANLVHSNVVPVFDFGNLDNEYFIAQEYIVGRDVSRLSERCVEVTGSPIPPRIAYHIVCETLQALHYAHTLLGPDGRALDIVHRDVSSINIMVTSSGDVKLFDFGIAKSNSRVTRTQAGMIKGNAHFMSPEHARGQPVDARSDVFSVGLVLYFCLTNQFLYGGANALEVLYKAACGPGEAELARIAALPPPAPQLLAAALEVDPSRRFETASDFAAALSPFAAGAKYQAADLVQGLFGQELRTELAV